MKVRELKELLKDKDDNLTVMLNPEPSKRLLRDITENYKSETINAYRPGEVDQDVFKLSFVNILDIDKLLNDGWWLVDTPSFNIDMWDIFIKCMENTNIIWLSSSHFVKNGESRIRGSYLMNKETQKIL